jgi:hypothetical protein
MIQILPINPSTQFLVESAAEQFVPASTTVTDKIYIIASWSNSIRGWNGLQGQPRRLSLIVDVGPAPLAFFYCNQKE